MCKMTPTASAPQLFDQKTSDGNDLGRARGSGKVEDLKLWLFISTKEYHVAVGLYDYGFRFYSAGLGRWINRDPIAERGGLNLYGFVGNSPLVLVDRDGRSPVAGGIAGGLIGGLAGFLGSLLAGGDKTSIACSTFGGAAAGALAGALAGSGIILPHAGFLVGALSGALTQACIEIAAAITCDKPLDFGSAGRILTAAAIGAATGYFGDVEEIAVPITNFMLNLDISALTNAFGPQVGGGCPNRQGVLY